MTKNTDIEFTISDLAKDFDVTTRTIRYYEDMGLLAPERRGQQRIYSPADKVKLKLVLRGKRLGLSLAESKEIIEMYDPNKGNNSAQLNHLVDKIDERRAQLQQQLHDIEVMLLDLDSAKERVLETLKNT